MDGPPCTMTRRSGLGAMLNVFPLEKACDFYGILAALRASEWCRWYSLFPLLGDFPVLPVTNDEVAISLLKEQCVAFKKAPHLQNSK